MKQYQISSLGQLKYRRLKSMSILRENLLNYGFEHGILETKFLFEELLNNKFNRFFDSKFKVCLDSIFEDNKYLEMYLVENEENFPINFIAPIG